MQEPKLSRAEVDAAVAAKTAPKVTLDAIKSRVVDAQYHRPTEPDGSPGVLVICTLTHVSGFKIVGKSAPASAENFDEEIGRRYAFEDAVKQLWPLEGFLLRCSIAGVKAVIS